MANSLATVLNEASRRLEQYDLGSALQLYQEVLRQQPDNAAGAMGLAMVLNRSGRPGEALQLLNRILASTSLSKSAWPTAQKAAVLAQTGLAQQELGQLSAALESYQQAARLMRSPDLDRRIQQISPLLSSPIAVQQLILHARRLHTSHQWEEASKTYIAALKLQPDNADALHELAMVLQELGIYDRALPLLQKAVILAPDRPEFFNDLGTLFQRRGDFDKAVSFHRRAIRLSPAFVFAFINLGVAYKRLGRNDESLAAYRQALTIDPDSCEAHNNLGNLLRVLGDLTLARRHLETALEIRPGYADARANLDAVMQALAKMKKPAAKKISPKPPSKAVTPKKKDTVNTVVAKKSVAKRTSSKPTAAKKVAVKSSSREPLGSVKTASKKPVAKSIPKKTATRGKGK